MIDFMTMMLVAKIFALLVIYQFKHWFADYPMQNDYMLQKFRGDWGFFLPLFAHAGVHGLFTLAIALLVNPSLWWLALVDLGVHFTMDRVKASPEMLGKFKSATGQQIMEAKAIVSKYASKPPLKNTLDEAELIRAKKLLWHNKLFWWFLGIDQSVHHLTHYFIIFILVIP